MDIIKKGEYMVEKNKIYNMNCHNLMNDMINENFKVDSIISQPPQLN